MENIPRNLEKDLVTFTPPKFSKRGKRRTLLAVEANGEVREIRQRRWGTLWFLLLMIALGAGGYFYFLYQNALKENQRLQGQVNALQQQVSSLQAEMKNAASAEIPVKAVPESPAPLPEPSENLRAGNPEQSVAEHSATEEPSEAQKDTDEISPEIRDAAAPDGDTAASADPEEIPEEPATTTVQPEKPGIISADEFNATYNRRRKILTAEVEIRNTDPNSNRVAGHAIAVLKRGTDPRRWLSMPPSDLVAGKPDGKQIGEAFAISRFKTLKFEAENISDPERFKTATVFIFTETGELMLEKDFPVMITE